MKQNSKPTGLSIAAFVLSILGCTSLIGVILGIVDLSKKDGKNKSLSIAAIAVGILMTICVVLFAIAGSSDKEEEAPTYTNDIKLPNAEVVMPDETPIPEPTAIPESESTVIPEPDLPQNDVKTRNELSSSEYCDKYATDFIVGASMTLDRFLADYDMSLAPQAWTLGKFDDNDTMVGTTEMSWQGRKGKFMFVGTLNFEGDEVKGVTPHFISAMDEVLGNDGYCDEFFKNIGEAMQYFNQ